LPWSWLKSLGLGLGLGLDKKMEVLVLVLRCKVLALVSVLEPLVLVLVLTKKVLFTRLAQTHPEQKRQSCHYQMNTTTVVKTTVEGSDQERLEKEILRQKCGQQS